MIEEIFSDRDRFNNSTVESRMSKGHLTGIDENEIISFPETTAQYFLNKYKVKALAYQKAADLLMTVKTNKNCKLIKIFSKLLSEKYNKRDMIFFIYVRSQVEKEMNVKFTELQKCKHKLVYLIGGQYIYGRIEPLITPVEIDSRNVYISQRVGKSIGYAIFKQNQELYAELLKEIEERTIKAKEKEDRLISAIEFLYITLNKFHNSRVDLKQKERYEKSELLKKYL